MELHWSLIPHHCLRARDLELEHSGPNGKRENEPNADPDRCKSKRPPRVPSSHQLPQRRTTDFAPTWGYVLRPSSVRMCARDVNSRSAWDPIDSQRRWRRRRHIESLRRSIVG